MLLVFKNYVKPDRRKKKYQFLTPQSYRNKKVKVALRKQLDLAIS